MKSCRGSSELIFVVLNFVTPEARYANDVNNRLKIRGWKNSWVENFATRGIVTKITKISTPRKLPAIRYIQNTIKGTVQLPLPCHHHLLGTKTIVSFSDSPNTLPATHSYTPLPSAGMLARVRVVMWSLYTTVMLESV